jgi:flagellar basal body rod protein FlgC
MFVWSLTGSVFTEGAMISSVRTRASGLRAASRALDVAAGNAVNARNHINADDAAVAASAPGHRPGSQDEAPFEGFMPHVVYDAADDADGDGDGSAETTTEPVRMQQAKALYGANAEVLPTAESLLGMVVNDRA